MVNVTHSDDASHNELTAIAPSVRQRERFFRQLVDSSLDIVTVLDERGTILFENRAVQDLLGYQPNELIGRSAFELVHPDDRGATIEV